jgi:hypothetical protein
MDFTLTIFQGGCIMSQLPADVSSLLERMRRLVDGIPHVYEGLERIAGLGEPDNGDNALPLVVAPATPDPVDHADSAQPAVDDQSLNRPQATTSVSQIVKAAFDKRGAMTTGEVLSYLEKTGMMEKVRAVCGNEARDKVKKTLYELRKQSLLSRADGKAITPWVPTPELHVRQNHLRVIGKTPVGTDSCQAAELEQTTSSSRSEDDSPCLESEPSSAAA